MNSRERVRRAIHHQEPDRVPIDLGGTSATTISVRTYAAHRAHLGLGQDALRINDVFSMTAEIGEDVHQRLETDVRLIQALTPRFGIALESWKPWRNPDGLKVEVPGGFDLARDVDGTLLLLVGGETVGRMPVSGQYFSEVANSTTGDAALSDPPDPDAVSFPVLTDEDLRFRQTSARYLSGTTDKALVVEIGDNLRWCASAADWMYALASDPSRAAELHEKKSRNLLDKVRQLAQALGSSVDIVAFYQDLGTQRSELISPQTFMEIVAPHYRPIFDWIHRNTNWSVFFHSCGSIYRLIPAMIEMGVDILNPVQTNADGMDAARLKAQFGAALTFWGGGVDTQTILPFGTIDEVRAQVRSRIGRFAPGGGYVFAPSQDIQPDVPAANVAAMYESAIEAGGYERSAV
jgi:uroporphyrinogen decarboxylase